MADTGLQPDPNATAQSVPSLSVRAQYMVDLSFENPAAPTSLMARETAPQVAISVDVNVRRAVEQQYEVILKIGARAHQSDDTIFAIELIYAGIFLLQSIPEDQIQPILFIECPRILFPFARRIIADVTRDGGFPPLMLEPIDFLGLFQAQRAAQRDGNQPRYDA